MPNQSVKYQPGNLCNFYSTRPSLGNQAEVGADLERRAQRPNNFAVDLTPYQAGHYSGFSGAESVSTDKTEIRQFSGYQE